MIDVLFTNITGWLAALTSDPSGIIGTPGTQAPPLSNVAADVATNVGYDVALPVTPAGGGISTLAMIAYAGVLLVAMYFLMFRGPRKREKKAREMQASLRAGDNVVVTGGMFGRIADVGEDCFVVEFGTNRGIRIPVLKSDVLGVREPKLTPPPRLEGEKDS
ncbi:MAG: preprotein translocase subunit YajC [Defluviitaleaceae bacterium]|nr:preprotein translocase subunit YajC [Defluviitaleaceae bacterium]